MRFAISGSLSALVVVDVKTSFPVLSLTTTLLATCLCSLPLFVLSAALIWDSEGAKKVDVQASGIDHGVTQNPFERRWSPYDFNGG